MKLDEGAQAEIKEFWTGSRCEIAYFARLFHVSTTCIAYFVNWNNCRSYYTLKRNEWRKNHPEAAREIGRRAAKKYYKTAHGIQKRRENFARDRELLKFYNQFRYAVKHYPL